jgi:hypothetical protein
MLRKIFTLGALVVVAVTFGVSTASAKSGAPGKGHSSYNFGGTGFSDGRD